MFDDVQVHFGAGCKAPLVLCESSQISWYAGPMLEQDAQPC